MKAISLKAPAKINLGLSILKRLSSGYHEVKFIFQQVSLFDRIHLKEIKKDEIKILCNDKSIPLNKINTVYQAALLIKRKMKIKKGIQIKIDKQIPTSAGLGGSSSNAAQTLIGLNRLWNLKLNTDDLLKLGVKIGMDVCYQLVGGTKMATHFGEKLKSLPELPKTYLVLSNPDQEVSTKWAYQKIDYSQVGKEQLKELIKGIQEKDIKKIAQELHNDFEFWVPNFYPAVLKIKEKLMENGALGAMMSGSGPTVFGLFETKFAAQKAYQTLKKDFPKTYLAETI